MGTVPPPDQVLTRLAAQVAMLPLSLAQQACPLRSKTLGLFLFPCVFHNCFNAMSARERKGKVTSTYHFTVLVTLDALPNSVLR